jgi:hypothetical protein
MRQEILSVCGVNCYTTHDYCDAWVFWRRGCLDGLVPWNKTISEYSIFPRIIWDDNVPAFLEERRWLNSKTDGCNVTAIALNTSYACAKEIALSFQA